MTIASTYRLQLHAGFGFPAAKEIVDYLDDLGITHAYASPYLAARTGSTHGYDLVDAKRLNPELGASFGTVDDDYRAWTDALAARKMGHIVDFVPNHMAASTANMWWRDVLENGQASIYADHFDIEWQSPKEGLAGKVLLPVLGAQYGEVLEKGELILKRAGGEFTIGYWERDLPVDPASVGPLLERTAQKLDLAADDPRRQDLESIAYGLAHLTVETPHVRAREKEVLRRRLAVLARDPLIADGIDAEVARMNGTPGDAHSYDDLDALLVAQNYRLAYWRVASDEINYRRFFEINDLAAIRMEHPRVFADMHEKLLELVADGRIQGIRLDHVDGLYDPAGYFAQLRERVGDLWIGAEKILSHAEKLPESWPIEGTTGYDWLGTVNGLLVHPRGEEMFTRIYRDFTGELHSFAEQVREAKRTVLRSSLSSELHMLALRLERIATRDRRSRDFTMGALRRALGETITAFPVYRTYVRPDGTRDPNDTQIVTRAIRLARARNPEVNPSVFDFLRDQLLFHGPEPDPDRVELAMRFQQLTGPVTAKGVEDTAFYTYVRFIGLNEVGGAPERFGTSIAQFHGVNAENAKLRPRTMTTTSTHDTKRGEDVRARLAVLSEMPDAFATWLREWEDLAAKHITTLDEEDHVVAPSPVDRLLFYQTVIGAWPFEPYRIGSPEQPRFTQRLVDYAIKAAREAKRDTSWLSTNDAYEAGLREFVTNVLRDPELVESFASKAAAIATYGASNGLAQAILKIASPGICDNYQGSETWDLRLVDPDNRAPVDYAALRKLLASNASPSELLESFRDGRLKLQLVARALRLRRAHPEIFVEGTYEPIPDGEEVVAFVRKHATGRIACAVTRFPWHATGGGKSPWATGPVWGERRLALPAGRWRNVLAGNSSDQPSPMETLPIVEAGGEGVLLRDLFRDLPVALLFEPTERA
jgi:(1->4)-alpha-D-glucan 1-alpha-D-glucosylmutase